MNYSVRPTQDAILSALESAAQDSAFGYNQKRPTPAQCEAENYKVGRFKWPAGGLTLCIQNPRYSTREGKSKAGVQWRCLMAAHYGYIEGTKGADGDAVDCFVGTDVLNTRVFVINQAFGGNFDEHKVMLCFSDMEQARSAYLRSYSKGWQGLGTIVECSVSQLRWWLRYGDTSKPLDPTKLPQERAPMKTTHWTSEALPLNGTVEDVLGAVREHDGADGLLYDCATLAEVLADPDVKGVLTMDALVTPFNMLERKMAIMRSVMDRAGGTVTTTNMQVSDPFKQRGTVNVAVLYELSDGQTITAFFHNPDSTPAKLAATDELVSWKWMLNKKDVTIVAAPERGKDLNVREVARRLMRLAEKNSEAFQKANAKRAERMAAIEGLKGEIAGLEATLAKAQDELALVKLQVEERDAQKAKSEDKHYSDQTLDALRELGWNATRSAEYTTVTKDFDGLRKPGGAENGRGVIYASFRQDANRRRYITVSDGDSDIFDIDCRGRDPVDVAKEINDRVNGYVGNRRAVFGYVDENRAKWGAEDAVHAPTPKDYAFSDSATGFNEWIEANEARYETAVAIDKAAVAAGMRIQWFKPGSATMDSATMDSAMGHAIAALAIVGGNAATNAPIHEAEGNAAQAALSEEVAAQAEEAQRVLEQYEAGELVAIGKALATPAQAITMDAAGGVGPCAAFYPAPGSALVGSLVIEDDGGAIVYADAKQEKPMHQTRLYAGDAVQAVELMKQVKTEVFSKLPAGLSDLEIAVLLVVSAYKSQYRADMAQKDTGMSKALYVSTLEKLNQQGKYIARNGITKEGRAVVAAFMPQELSSTSKLRVFKGRFDGVQAPSAEPSITEPSRTGAPEEQAKADEAMAMAQGVVQELGGTFEADGFATGATVGAWSYGNATVNGVELKLAASGGGVVQVNGKPHDPSGKVITTREQVRAAILEVAPSPDGLITVDGYTYKIDTSDGFMVTFVAPETVRGLKLWAREEEAINAKIQEVIDMAKSSPYLSKRWNSVRGEVTHVALSSMPTMGEGSETYDIVYANGQVMRRQAKDFDEAMQKEAYEATPEGAAAVEAERAKRQAEMEAAAARREAEEKTAAERKQALDAMINEWLDTTNYTPVQKGSARAILSKEAIYREFDNAQLARVEFVQRVVERGAKTEVQQVNRIKDKTRMQMFRMDSNEQREHERKVREGGTVAEYSLGNYIVTKTEYDYANYLIGKKTAAEVEVTPEATTTTNPDRTLLEGIVAGTVDAASVDLDELEAIYNRNADDPEMAALFDKAVEVVAQAEAAATANV